MERIRNILAHLRGQLWIIPLAISALALGLAYWVLTHGSALLKGWDIDEGLWWLYGGDVGAARELLASLLSGLITMTSLVVSVTFVILTLAASQLGPRLISTFMADRQIQTILGLFLGTILYVLIVLRSLDETLGQGGVPHIAVTVGSLLTAVCLFALLFYVHKIASSIIADNVVMRVAGDLHRDISNILPDDATDTIVPEITALDAGSLSLDRSGYIQVVDYGRLVSVACKADAILRVNVRAGHFVLRSGDHVTVHALRPLDTEAADAVRSAFIVGSERSPAQDMEYGLRQLVEIALRALSPGINDLFTAIAVINQLGAVLEEILRRSLPPMVLRDEAGTVRVIAQRSDVQGLIDAAFDTIRQAGSDMPAILIRIADTLGKLAPVLRTEEMRQAVASNLGKLAETAGQARLTPSDRTAVMVRIAKARELIPVQFEGNVVRGF